MSEAARNERITQERKRYVDLEMEMMVQTCKHRQTQTKTDIPGERERERDVINDLSRVDRMTVSLLSLSLFLSVHRTVNLGENEGKGNENSMGVSSQIQRHSL